jgi:serine/threonine protein kinase
MTTSGGPYRVGQEFGPYRLEAYLGAGAFKSVYRATRRLGAAGPDTLALGFPHQQDPDGIAELEKEAAVNARLVHPNILRVYGIERHEGISFLVMEYLSGHSLRKRLREAGRLAPDEALRYVGLVAEALAYAHAGRVLHRDVKPENIFVSADGTPKLLDFGIARVLAHTMSVASTRVGTVDYMAPEHFQGAAGTNADLWSLGVTFYELLTGRRPFRGEPAEVMHAVMHTAPDDAPLHEAGIDPRLIRVIRKMLDKDPTARYATAEDLANELELVARRTRLVEDDESRLEVLIRASFPLVYILSFEEDRVLAAVRDIAARLSSDSRRRRAVYVWSASQGLRDGEGKLVSPDTREDPTAALVNVIESPGDALYVFLDMHRHFSPVTTRLVRDAARAVRTTRKSLLFVSPQFALPAELEKEVTLAVFQLPDRRQLDPMLGAVCEELTAGGLKADLSPDDRLALLRAASGLTLAEAERAFRAAASQEGGLSGQSARRVAQTKSQIIRKSGILEYYHKCESQADVGGLENLHDWFCQRAPAFASTARYAGLPVPKGVLLVGVPGCGKSLSARALAGTWGVPLLRLDIGRLFGSIVGESESNLRLAIQTAEAVSPCILWIDEIEKGFAGVGGPQGGRVAGRVFGSFLNWLQEKQSPVFVVATANDITHMPPELMRKGRFDEIFFVGLPSAAERETILRIHLVKRRRDPARFDMADLAAATAGFSGAEIEQAINEGLFRAFHQDREIETVDIRSAATDTFPLSRSRGPQIATLIQWAAMNARPAGAVKESA